MRNQGQLFFGGLILVLGVALLIGNIFNLDVWAICWPLGLILLGVWLVARPRLALPGTGVNLRPLGDVKRFGAWQVAPEEIWMFVGDVRLDMTRAEIPPGETVLRIFGFVGDVDLLLPQDAGVSVSSNAFLTDSKILGHKSDRFLVPLSWESPGYQANERKVRLETNFFVVDLDLAQL